MAKRGCGWIGGGISGAGELGDIHDGKVVANLGGLLSERGRGEVFSLNKTHVKFILGRSL